MVMVMCVLILIIPVYYVFLTALIPRKRKLEDVAETSKKPRAANGDCNNSHPTVRQDLNEEPMQEKTVSFY
jgi:hypothetical protein